MKAPRQKPPADRQRIALEGEKYARSRFENSRKAVQAAMDTIEAEIEANDGLYPLNGGRVTVGEVLLRAKKSQGYLRKTKDQPELAELRSDVDAFVDRVAKAFASGAKSVRKLVTERADEAQEDVRKIRQAWVEAELEHNETRIQLAAAREQIKAISAENAALAKQLAGKKVVDLDSRRK
jgi:uncharacterized membrane-anchored protein YhcB (DUF1043 family)